MAKRQRRGSQLPQVNLVPMMDVLMTVLTFFIIISMTLTGQQVMNVSLPSAAEGVTEGAGDVDPFIVGLNPQNQILVENQPISNSQLVEQVQAYLSANPEGVVLVKADRELVYEDVAELLETLRDIGGDRVSLAIEQ
ncbi:MAG: biopolymer transporter ExbD [Leptolyngbyaceae cyanobacterium RM1_406_9]|nr:biopolymer transporter ExbD [Leptolyngbyaceae cyanobacterium RM1_406_9]